MSELYDSHYFLMDYNKYDDQYVKNFLKGISQRGITGTRTFSMLDVWQGSFSPWADDFSDWDEQYWRRLDYICTLCERYKLKLILVIFCIQETKLSRMVEDFKRMIKERFGENAVQRYLNGEIDIPGHEIFEKLEQFIEELRNRGFAQRIREYELLNECGDELLLMVEKIASMVKKHLCPSKIWYSGEAPNSLARFYDVYSPHGFGGHRPAHLNLSNTSFPFDMNPEEIEYLRSIQRNGKELVPSSDGKSFNEEEAEFIFNYTKNTWHVATYELDHWPPEETAWWTWLETIIKGFERIYGALPKPSATLSLSLKIIPEQQYIKAGASLNIKIKISNTSLYDATKVSLVQKIYKAKDIEISRYYFNIISDGDSVEKAIQFDTNRKERGEILIAFSAFAENVVEPKHVEKIVKCGYWYEILLWQLIDKVKTWWAGIRNKTHK